MPPADLLLRRVLDGALDAVVEVAASGTVVGWNAEAARLLGWNANEAVGRRLDELALDPDHWPVLRDAQGTRIDLTLRDRAGNDVPVGASVTAAGLGDGRVLVAFLRDLRPDHRRVRLRRAERDVVALLAGAAADSDPMHPLLDIIGRALGVDLCEWWLREADALVCVARWGEQLPAFAATGEGMRTAEGQGLAGRAWEAMRPVSDAGSAIDVARATEGAVDGLRSGLAVPVLAGPDLVGVIAVWSSIQPSMTDDETTSAIEAIAAALGQFHRRRRTELVAGEDDLALATAVRAARGFTRGTDPGAVRTAICDAALAASGATIAYLAEPEPGQGGLLVTAVAGAELRDGPPALLPFDAPSAAIEAHRSRAPVFVPDVAASASEETRRSARELGTVSGFVQPIGHDDADFGVLGVTWSHAVPRLGRHTAAVMALLADEAAFALRRVALLRHLEAQARTDPLTGLPNLRAWDEVVSRELASASRDGRPLCIAVCDVDGFKGYNDTRGHPAGDRLLCHAATSWQRSLRAGDVLARLGGDEFAALLPNCRTGGALVLAERLRRSMPEGGTCSIGVAAWDGRETAQELVARADAALYEAKALGRDRVVAR